MRSKLFLIACLLLLALPAFAQSAGGYWAIDPRTGCKVVLLRQPGLSASWSGNCNQGIAVGFGSITLFRQGGQQVTRDQGVVVNGRFSHRGPPASSQPHSAHADDALSADGD
jgi:hypothetical protein